MGDHDATPVDIYANEVEIWQRLAWKTFQRALPTIKIDGTVFNRYSGDQAG
jgi:hypothetical protein